AAAGAVLKIEAGGRIHRKTGMVLGGSRTYHASRRRALLQAKAAIYAAVGVDYLGLRLQGQLQQTVNRPAFQQLRVGIKGEARRRKQVSQTLVDPAGATFLADIGGFAAEAGGPPAEKGALLHQGRLQSGPAYRQHSANSKHGGSLHYHRIDFNVFPDSLPNV